jgi:hypothetical protein
VLHPFVSAPLTNGQLSAYVARLSVTLSDSAAAGKFTAKAIEYSSNI